MLVANHCRYGIFDLTKPVQDEVVRISSPTQTIFVIARFVTIKSTFLAFSIRFFVNEYIIADMVFLTWQNQLRGEIVQILIHISTNLVIANLVN